MSNQNLVAAAKGDDPGRRLVLDMMPQIIKALPKHLDSKRFERLCLTQLRNPAIAKCGRASVYSALMEIGQLGLEPDKNMGHVYIVPYKGQATVIVGYRGMIELAKRSGRVRSIMARVAYENDRFLVVCGTEERIEHVPTMGDRGDPVAVYAVAKLKDGAPVFDWMTWPDVQRIKKAAKAKYGPWVDHEEEMARKTVVRKLCKYLSLSPEVARATALEEAPVAPIGIGRVDTVDMHAAPVIDVEPSEPEPSQSLFEWTADEVVAVTDAIGEMEKLARDELCTHLTGTVPPKITTRNLAVRSSLQRLGSAADALAVVAKYAAAGK